MATLSLRNPKIIITSRNRVSTPGDFPRRILPIDDRHGVISGTWLHSADVATTSHFLRDEGKKELQCGPHVTVVQGKYSPKYSYKLHACTVTPIASKSLFIVPTDAHYYKIIEILKQFKIIILAPTYFGSRRNHHQGAVLCLAKTTK